MRLLRLFLALSFISPLHGQLTRNLDFIQRLPAGEVQQSVFFNQNYLVVYGGYVDFFDVSQADARFVSRLFRNAYVMFAAVNAPYLFLNLEEPGGDRQEIWDISELRNPRLLTEFRLFTASSQEFRVPGSSCLCRKIHWAGSRALALDTPTRLLVHDSSNVTQWRETDRLETPTRISDFAVRSDRLYVATVGTWEGTNFRPGKFSVYRLEPAGKVTKLTSVEDPSARVFTFHFAKDFIYLFISKVNTSPSEFILLDKEGKQVNPSGELPRELSAAIDSAVHENYLFLNRPWNFVYVFDVSDPLQPRFVSQFSDQPNKASLSLSIRLPFLYRTFPDLIERYTLADPKAPQAAGTLPVPTKPKFLEPSEKLFWTEQEVFHWEDGGLRKIAVLPQSYETGRAAGNVFVGISGRALDVWRFADQRVSLSRTVDISEITNAPTSAGRPSLAIVGDFAYVAGLDHFSASPIPFGSIRVFDYSHSLVTVDLRTLEKTSRLSLGPKRALTGTLSDLTLDVRLLGQDLFAGSRIVGGKILDLSDPARPAVKRDAKAFEVSALKSEEFYYSAEGGTLDIFQVKNDQQVLFQRHRPPGKTGGGEMVALHDRLILFQKPDRATVLDVANPLGPLEIAEFALFGRDVGISGLAYSGGYLYVNSPMDGIAVFRLRQETLFRQIVPHFATGVLGNTRYVSSLLLFNNSEQPQSGTVTFRDTLGRPLDLTIQGQQRSSLSWDLTPGGAKGFLLESTPVQSGWIEIVQTTRGLIGVSLIFQILVNNKIVSESAVLSSREVNEAALFQDFLEGFRTGVAIVNTAAEDQVVELTLRKLDGQRVKAVSVTLPAGVHLARFTDELFPDPDFNGLLGRLEVIAPRGVTLLSLKTRGHFWGALSTDALGSMTETYFLPQLVVGKESTITYETLLYVTNQLGREGKLEVEIFDSAGQPMEVSVWGNLWSRFDTVLSPTQTAVYKLSRADRKPTAGWIRVKGPEGLRVSMVFSFSREGQPVAGAGVTQTASDRFWLAFVQVAPGTDTGVAVVNSSITRNRIRWILQDGTGTALAEATEELAPGQQKARFVTELFPAFFAGRPVFQGTLRMEGDLAFSTILLRLSNSHLTTVPLIKPKLLSLK